MTDATGIRKYWEERASQDRSAQSTTLDYYLRDIEFRVLREAIAQRKPLRVFDIGCGDAFTTLKLCSAFPETSFVGGDYSRSMLDNADKNLRESDVRNIDLVGYDLSSPIDVGTFELAYTTRCLINLPGWEIQRTAIRNISRLLKSGGAYVMIENFLDGHRELNELRRKFDLPEIKIRHHNFFLEQELVLDFVKEEFEVEEMTNISSTYYMVTRVIYSKICQMQGVEPDYFDEHHKLASTLPFCGNYGPIKVMILKKM
jgi:ubiquinone/menaquinone biosynthesis C-methylase UbiE